MIDDRRCLIEVEEEGDIVLPIFIDVVDPALHGTNCSGRVADEHRIPWYLSRVKLRRVLDARRSRHHYRGKSLRRRIERISRGLETDGSNRSDVLIVQYGYFDADRSRVAAIVEPRVRNRVHAPIA